MMYRTLVGITIVFIIVVAFTDYGFGQSNVGPSWICDRLGQKKLPKDSEITLRAHPFNAATITIDRSGARLLKTIEAIDLLAVRAETLIIAISPLGNSGDDKDKHFYLSKAAPNTILLSRGRKIIVFPRIFLIHPKFENFLIQPNDFVGTVCLQRESPDPLRDHLLNTLGYRTKTIDQNQIRVSIKDDFNGISKSVDLSDHANPIRIKSTMEVHATSTDENALLRSQLVIHAVQRHHDGIDYLLLYPAVNCGVMGNSGVLFRSLFRENLVQEDVWLEEWENVFGSFDFQIIDGDRILTTSVELLDIF